MPKVKTAGETQVAWALLSEGVSQARLEAHRLRHLLTRSQAIIDKSEEKEHIYQVAGDLLISIPKRMDALERVLDRTSYALSVLGADHLRDRLSMSDRSLIDDATFQAKPFGGGNPRSSSVAYRYLCKQADLQPPLGEPGGVCHVIRRIEQEVRNPTLRAELIEDVQQGTKLENADAAKVYDIDVEPGPSNTKWKRIQIVQHAQFRMDQRSVSVADIQEALKAFMKAWSDDKSRKGPKAARWESAMARGEPISWVSPKNLNLVFLVVAPDAVRIITTYWEGKPDPRPVGKNQCQI